MFSDEAAAPYDRTLLTKDYLDGNFGEDRLPIARHSLDAMGVNFEGEAQVASIDVENKRLQLANGETRSYSKLLLATGAAPRKLDLPGSELPHVIALRSLADCRRILDALKDVRYVAVIGGSFIALETAASLRSRGLSVSVIAPEPHPMETIFGARFVRSDSRRSSSQRRNAAPLFEGHAHPRSQRRARKRARGER